MPLDFLSCVQTGLLSASYDNYILKAKQLICLESLYLKTICQEDSYRSWKTWKVMEFKDFIFQAWKVIDFNCRSVEVMEN